MAKAVRDGLEVVVLVERRGGLRVFFFFYFFFLAPGCRMGGCTIFNLGVLGLWGDLGKGRCTGLKCKFVHIYSI